MHRSPLDTNSPAVESVYSDNENVGERERPTSPIITLRKQLQDELSQKHMLFGKHHIQLGGVVGQGNFCDELKPCKMYVAGESGLVYRGYITTGEGCELVAIKTGKGMQSEFMY